MTQTDEQQRWGNYRKANRSFPYARKAEIDALLSHADVLPGETVLEIGTGSGIATFPLARAVGTGKLYTFDVNIDNLQSVLTANTEGLPIVLVPQSFEGTFPLVDNSIDRIVNIAAFHHYDDRSKDTGTTGRLQALKEFYRLLKPGSHLVLADPAKDTPAQRYFDAVDTPVHCHPCGHPHDFVSKEEMLALCKDAGFKDAQFEVVETPWMFKDEDEAKTFIHTLHNSQCTPDESLALAKKHLSYEKTAEGVKLGWSLFYLVARK